MSIISTDYETPTIPEPAKVSLKERQRQEREELILDAAEAVLTEKGYQSMSMDEIAARVGVAKGTLYLHFPSKDDLVVALFIRVLAHFRQAVKDAAALDASAKVRLEQILRHTYQGMRGQRTQLFLSLYTNVALRTEVFEKSGGIRDHMTELADSLSAVLDEGKSRGEFDTTIPTQILLTTFLGLLSPRGYRHLLTEAQLAPEELASYVGRIFFNGISHIPSKEQ